jgi:O-antigen/teichoic acid export membrane protein
MLTTAGNGDISPLPTDRSIIQAAKGGSIVFTGNMFSYGSQLILGILLTRFLGAEQYGQYKVAVIAGEIAVGVALLGMDYAMVRFISLYNSLNNLPKVLGTIQFGVGLTIFSSVVIGIGLFALANPLANFIFHEPLLVPVLRIASLIVPVSTLSSVLGAATMGFNNMRYSTISKQIAQPITRLVLLIPLVYVGLNAKIALMPYIAGLLVTCGLLLYYLRKLIPIRNHPKTSQRDPKELMRFSLPAYFSSLIDNYGPSLQTILLGSLNTITNAGIYSVAHQVSVASSLFNQSIGTASSPIISDLHGKGENAQMARFYTTTTKWMFTVNLPMFLVVVLLSKPILSIFGNEFMGGSTTLIVLSLANLVIASAGIADGVLAMTGHTPTRLVNSIVLTVISLGLCFILIPHWGPVGTALAAFAAAFVTSLLRVSEVYYLDRYFPYNLSFIKPIAAGSFALVISLLAQKLVNVNSEIVHALLHGIIILTSYAIMIFLLGISKEDQSIFTHLRAHIMIKLSKK